MTPTEQIDQLIANIPDWRGAMLGHVRKTILAADPAITEDWKWRGSPVWSRDGMIAVGNPHKDKVKLTFSHGASLPDPDKLFNNGFNGKVWRAIDLFEGDTLDEQAMITLVRAAIAFNQSRSQTNAPARTKAATQKPASKSA
jgi:hypothetical protein